MTKLNPPAQFRQPQMHDKLIQLLQHNHHMWPKLARNGVSPHRQTAMFSPPMSKLKAL